MSSARFAELAASLGALERRLDEIEAASFGLLDEIESRIGAAAASWSGPRQSVLSESTSSYLAAARRGPDAISQARTSLRALQRLADAAQAEMAVHELTIAGVDLVRSLGVPLGPEQLRREWEAMAAIAEIETRWRQRCSIEAATIGEAVSIVRSATEITPTAHGVPAVSAAAHAERIAVFAERADIDPAAFVYAPPTTGASTAAW